MIKVKQKTFFINKIVTKKYLKEILIWSFRNYGMARAAFLADSLKYNRTEDLGYLVCRIFINRENHFFIESKGSIGIKYSMFSFEPINKEQLIEVVNELIIFAISFIAVPELIPEAAEP